MNLDYKEDMRIDEAALDIEWLNQAPLATKWGMHWSRCKTKVMLLEEQLKVVRSDLVAQAYQDPDKYLGKGIKATQQTVEAYFRKHPKHKAAKERLFEAMEELNDAEIIKSEISFTRKAALENLVKLHGQMYFAGPSVPRDLSAETKRNRNATREASNKRVRLNR